MLLQALMHIQHVLRFAAKSYYDSASVLHTCRMTLHDPKICSKISPTTLPDAFQLQRLVKDIKVE